MDNRLRYVSDRMIILKTIATFNKIYDRMEIKGIELILKSFKGKNKPTGILNTTGINEGKKK